MISTLAIINNAVLNVHREISDVGYIGQEKDGSLDAVELTTLEGEGSQPQQYDAHHHHSHIDRRDALDLERRNGRTGTNDKRDIEDIGANHIAQGELILSLHGSYHTCGKLGERGAHSHERDGDEGLRYMEALGNAHRMVYKEPSAKDESGQSQYDKQDSLAHRHGLGCRCLIIGTILGRLEGVDHKHSKYQKEAESIYT